MSKPDEFLEKYCTCLSPRERDCVRLRYGIDDGRMRHIEEISELFGVTKKTIKETLKTAESKIDEIFSAECGTQASMFGYYFLVRCIFVPDASRIINIDFVKLKEAVDAALQLDFTENEQKVLQLRMGLLDNTEKSFKAIGELLGISGERVRQLEGKALRKLRHPKRNKQIKEYFYDLENI